MANKQPKTADGAAGGKGQRRSNAEQHDNINEPLDPKQAPRRGWDVGSLFWGLLLVAFGGLLLLGNLGVIEVRWGELWRLWPLLIVAVGFSVLATTHWIWKILSVGFIVAAIFAVLWVGLGRYDPDPKNTTNQNTVASLQSGVTNTDVTIRAGASKLTVQSEDMADIVRASLQSDGLALKEQNSREGDTQKVVLSSESQRGMWFGTFQNEWDVVLSERLPMRLTIDAGASSIDADLSQLRLTDVAVKAGASSSVLTLGSKNDTVRVAIDSGASSMTLRVPKDSGVTMNFDGGLSAREFGDLKEVSKGVYKSDNADTAAKRLIIDADAGLASFRIERY